MRQSGHIKMLLPLCLLAMLIFCRVAIAEPISLQVHQIAGRTVQLDWDAGTGTTDIYRRYPDENQLSLIGSTSSNTWTDRHNRSVCNDTVYYVVRRGGDEGSAAINISDNEPTAPAQWGVVTVDQALQHIKLEWIASQDTDIMGYLVLEGTPSLVFDTVYGRTNTTYIYTQDSCTQVREFRINAFDSCRKASALTDQCNNMVLHLESEPCSRTLTARWNTYNNMPSGLGRYELWVSQDDAAFVLAGQQNNISDTSIDFTITEECQQVKAYVKAVSADGTLEALSNIKQEVLATSQRPSLLYLRKVSVSDDGKNVTVVGQTDTSWAGHQYTVYRSVGDGFHHTVWNSERTYVRREVQRLISEFSSEAGDISAVSQFLFHLITYIIPGSMIMIRSRSPVPHASMLAMYIMLIVVLISDGTTGLVGSPIGSLS